ncbi:MAG: protein kinase domain-containing protein [Terriglobales bacterium]
MLGQTITHYRILKKLGSGGMGLVYEAEDIRLGRRVALKFIPENISGNGNALARFEQEARTTSSLNHPNIATIYDIASHNGLPFIVMELLQGESIKDRLERTSLIDIVEVLDIAIQLADALDAAHASGIVHRDLKPGNIFLTNRGQAKILDFGLAKLAPDQQMVAEPVGAGRRHKPAEAITEMNVIPGTTVYMSPEQARNEPLDPRSDLFSLGIVLYEMATGRKPFMARTSVLALDAIQHQRPVSPLSLNPELPSGFEPLVGKLLEKNRDDRYQSAHELATDLRLLRRDLEMRALGAEVPTRAAAPSRTFRKLSVRQIYALVGIAGLLVMILLVITVWWAKHGRGGPVPVAANNTIVVLPFTNVSGDPDTDFLRFALPDELVKILAYSRALEIRPVPTAAKYVGADPAQAGRELKAANVLTGHFMSQGDRLIITLDDIDVRHNRLVWQGSVTVPAANLISLQGELANEVRHSLLPTLSITAEAISSATQPRNADAYDLYLRGSSLPHDPAPNSTAITMLERAVELDAQFAPAWDALALRYYYDASYSGGGQAMFDKSAEAYEKALKLDPNLISSAAHLTRNRAERGQIALAYKEAVELVHRRPENAQSHFTLAYVLRYAGLLQDAARECDSALALDPSNYDFRSCSFVFFELGNSTRALEYLQLDSGSEWAASVLPAVLLRQGDVAGARSAATKMSSSPAWFAGYFQACVKPVSPAELTRMTRAAVPEMLALRDPEFRYYHGAILAWCGKPAESAEVIRSAIQQNYCANSALHADPALNKLRASPEFAAVAAESAQCQDRFLSETGQRKTAGRTGR